MVLFNCPCTKDHEIRRKIYIMTSIRSVNKGDAATIQKLARLCFPLEIHTHYTYWVCSNYYQKSSFILEKDKEPIGYIMAIESPDIVFIWQIGIIPEFRKRRLSKNLIDACVEYSRGINKNIEVTISEDNEDSLATFSSYCSRNKYEMVYCDDAVVVNEFGEEFERERRYRIILKRTTTM